MTIFAADLSQIPELNDQDSFCSQFCKLMKNIAFILIVLANTFIFFILTGI